MGPIQKQIEQWINGVPRQLSLNLLDQKLRAQNIKVSKKRLNELIDRLLSGDVVNFDFGSRHKDKSIEFTDEDLASLHQDAERLMERLPQIIEETTLGFSSSLLETLKKRWRRESRAQRRDIKGFRARLDERWGSGLQRLRMLVTVAREFGDSFNKEGSAAGGGEHPKTFEVLRRLHARSCQVTEEVLCLLSNGYADGAMARWRTLHEISAVAYLLHKHGDDLAERYIAHRVIEARGASIQYRKYQERLGIQSISDIEHQKTEDAYQTAVQTFGDAFATQYGWAAKHVGKSRPTLADIFEAAGAEHLGPYYKMASHNVHANPQGIFFKLGIVGESEVLLAGPSNGGLADPGHATALALLEISSVLMQHNPTPDNLVAVKIMERLADEIGESMLAAHQKICEDERYLRP
jgi:hypothetical protein